MQEFFILKGSTNPVLEMELIKDGRYDFRQTLFNESIQDSKVTFSMRNRDTGVMKISKAKANIMLSADDTCEDRYVLQYRWNERDVNQEGIYEGWFEIKFNENIISEGVDYPKGNLKVPIEEGLLIIVK
jgi:hypothetical protein